MVLWPQICPHGLLIEYKILLCCSEASQRSLHSLNNLWSVQQQAIYQSLEMSNKPKRTIKSPARLADNIADFYFQTVDSDIDTHQQRGSGKACNGQRGPELPPRKRGRPPKRAAAGSSGTAAGSDPAAAEDELEQLYCDEEAAEQLGGPSDGSYKRKDR
jgi:hypothetical protein